MKTLLVGITAIASFAAHATLIDFNGGSELNDDFAGFSNFTQSGTGGLDNTGSVTLTSTSQIAIYQNQAFDATAFSDAKVGIYFQFNSVGNNFSSRPLSIGFTGDAANTYKSSSENNVSSTDSTTANDIRVQLVGGGGVGGTTAALRLVGDGVQADQSSVNITMVQDNWYYMELRIGGVSGGDLIGVEGELFNASSDGTIGSSLKNLNNGGTGGYDITSGLSSDSAAYSYFGGFVPSNSVARVDNFSAVIPEPSTFVLVGVAFGTLAFFRRRNR